LTATPLLFADRGMRIVIPTAGPNDRQVYLLAALAFDRQGQLWLASRLERSVLMLDVAQLSIASPVLRDVQASRTLVLPASTDASALAFDEQGGLFVGYGPGRLARLSPTQQLTASSPSAPLVPERTYDITGLDRSLTSIALYPAPALLPLYHRARAVR
jgi:hypothetical protein